MIITTQSTRPLHKNHAFPFSNRPFDTSSATTGDIFLLKGFGGQQRILRPMEHIYQKKKKKKKKSPVQCGRWCILNRENSCPFTSSSCRVPTRTGANRHRLSFASCPPGNRSRVPANPKRLGRQEASNAYIGSNLSIAPPAPEKAGFKAPFVTTSLCIAPSPSAHATSHHSPTNPSPSTHRLTLCQNI